jgi:peptide/nickel transport system permease protein
MTVPEKEFDIDMESIPAELFSLKLSLKARWRELKFSISLLRKSPLFVLGTFIVVFLVVVAVAAPFIAPYGPTETATDPVTGEIETLKEPLTEDERAYLLWSESTNIVSNFPILESKLPEGIKTFVQDFNNDGFNDILIGTEDGELIFFINSGQVGAQIDWIIDEDYVLPTVPSGLTKISPTAGDINADGTIDIIIGGSDGKLYLSENIGTFSEPNWTPFTALQDNLGADIQPVVDGASNPTLTNYDGDAENTLDLIIGSTDKDIRVYRNTGTNTSHIFSLIPTAPKYTFGGRIDLSSKKGSGDFKVIATFVDNKDNRSDLIVLFESGEKYFYKSSGILLNPDFIELNQQSDFTSFLIPEFEITENTDFQWIDLTGEGFSDLIIFYTNGSIIEQHQYFDPDPRTHYFGTDDRGGDVFSRIVWALQTDLLLSIWIVIWSVLIGVFVGAISGYFGGWIDQVFMRLTDIVFAFPGLILAMAISAALGRSLFNLAIALIVVGWAGYARLIRGQVLAEKGKLYVDAARATGVGNFTIIYRHVLPNSMYPILVAATLDLGVVLLAAAGLSFIGFGANPGDAELGRMIADGRSYLTSAPWMVFFPGLAIAILVLAFNLIGDGLRDILDPKLRR